jgi:hypothetical protein
VASLTGRRGIGRERSPRAATGAINGGIDRQLFVQPGAALPDNTGTATVDASGNTTPT